MNKYILNKNNKSLDDKKVVTLLDYSLEFNTTNVDFNNIKYCYLGTGVPNNKFTKDLLLFEDFTTNSKSNEDNHGLSTMIHGVVNSDNTFIKGICKNIDLYGVKVFSNKTKTIETDDNCIVSAILWAVIKKVDVIVIPFEIKDPSIDLINAFKKAYSSNICIFVNTNKRNYESNSFFNESIEILGVSTTVKEKNIFNIDIKDEYYTTSINNSFAKVSSNLAPVFAGCIASKLIKEYREKNKKYTSINIYNELLKIGVK